MKEERQKETEQEKRKEWRRGADAARGLRKHCDECYGPLFLVLWWRAAWRNAVPLRVMERSFWTWVSRSPLWTFVFLAVKWHDMTSQFKMGLRIKLRRFEKCFISQNFGLDTLSESCPMPVHLSDPLRRSRPQGAAWDSEIKSIFLPMAQAKSLCSLSSWWQRLGLVSCGDDRKDRSGNSEKVRTAASPHTSVDMTVPVSA